MASIMENFSNEPIDINLLPRFEEVEYTAISGRYLLKSNLQTSSFLVIILIVLSILWYYEAGIQNLQISGVVIFLFFAFRFWNNYKMQKNYGYALREKDILYKHGFFVDAVTIIPFNRIQHVAVSRDFIDKMLNIASLQIYTAGGSGSDINIPGLSPELAATLKEALSTKLTANEQ